MNTHTQKTNGTTSSGWVHTLINEKDELLKIIKAEMAPLAISFPRQAKKRAEEFKEVLNSKIHNNRIFFAQKSSHSPSILIGLRDSVGIDVASSKELENALAAGYKTNNIVATGPKTDEFLSNLISNVGSVIIVDSYNELRRLSHIVKDNNQRILIRLSRSILSQERVGKSSRFGVDKTGLKLCLELLKNSEKLSMNGLAFHLDTQSIREKTFAIKVVIDLIADIQTMGFSEATILDIGGGFGKTNGYAQKEYEEVKLRELSYLNGESVAMSYWNDYFPGSVGDELSYPVGVSRLTELLDSEIDAGRTVADYINDYLLELWIEPGASIAEPSGAFVAEVIELKSIDGEYIVVANANRSQLEFGPVENLKAPLLITKQKDKVVVSNEGFYIAGNLCLESDMISFKKINLGKLPEAGDLLVWANTGAYRNYFNQTQAIGQRIAAKYALMEGKLVKEYDL